LFLPVLVEKYLSAKTLWTVPLATILGSPLYANSVSVIPGYGSSGGERRAHGNGTGFYDCYCNVSIPQAMILKKVMRWQLLTMFFGITIIGIMIMGYIFNAVLYKGGDKL
jgi:uncharacterized protein